MKYMLGDHSRELVYLRASALPEEPILNYGRIYVARIFVGGMSAPISTPPSPVPWARFDGWRWKSEGGLTKRGSLLKEWASHLQVIFFPPGEAPN
jgi:hypothetical protein